jgi:ribosome biogenesis GTPase
VSFTQCNNLIPYGFGESHARQLEKLTRGPQGLPAALEPGRIVAAARDIFLVQTAAGELWCRVSGKLRARAAAEDLWPCAGDWVALRRHGEGSDGTLEAVLPRQTALLRHAAGRRSRAQALAVNMELVLLLMGLDGNFNPARMERLAAVAWGSGAQPVAVLTKSDLVESADAHVLRIEGVVPFVPVHAVSALSGAGLAELRALLAPGKTGVMIGSSGVGKSTLLNRFAGAELRRTREVRASDSRGRHTTSLRELFLLPGGGCLIDTPGLREVGVWGESGGLEETFADVAELAERCRFRDCAHRGEPGCAVAAALAEGRLDPERYQSYLKLRRELRFARSRSDERLRREREQWGKEIARQQRSFDKSSRG